MRKTFEILLLILTLLLFITAFVSCKKSEAAARDNASQQLAIPFSCKANIKVQGKTYEVQLVRTGENTGAVTFTKPSELSSLSFVLGSKGMQIKYGELTADVDPGSIPRSAVISALMETFKTACAADKVHASLHSGNIQLSGQSQAEPFTLTLSRNYVPKSLQIPGIGLSAVFSGYQYA